MKNQFSCFFRCCMLFMLALVFQVGAAPSETFDSSVRLSGHVPNKAMSKAVFLKRLEPNAHIPLTFMLPLRDQEALEEFIQRIYDPADQQHYGKYLTPEEFAERFAPTQEDYDHVVSYVKSLGLTVTGTHANRTLLNVSG